MRLILFAILFLSCNNSDNNTDEDLQQAIKNGDTALAKKLAQEEVNKLRSQINDSAFALLVDLNLQLQRLEFALPAGDTSQMIADKIIVNGPGGQRLYNLAMRTYRLGLTKTSRHSDISSYTKELGYGKNEWLSMNFAGKTNIEAKKSLWRIQRDAAIISAIVNDTDTDKFRKETEDLYKKIIE